MSFYGNGETKFRKMETFFRLPALQKLSNRLEMVYRRAYVPEFLHLAAPAAHGSGGSSNNLIRNP